MLDSTVPSPKGEASHATTMYLFCWIKMDQEGVSFYSASLLTEMFQISLNSNANAFLSLVVDNVVTADVKNV